MAKTAPKIKIILKGNVPSKKNSKRRIQRGHHIFMVPSKAHEDWHGTQMRAMAEYKYYPGARKPLEIIESCVLTFYPDTKRKSDLSNKAESVMDLLVDCGVLADDNWFVVPQLMLGLGGVDKKDPRVEIEIY